MPFIWVYVNTVDHKGKQGQFRVHVNIENGGLAAIPQVVKYIAHTESKLVNANLVDAYARVDVDAAGVWLDGQLAGNDEQGALAGSEEKARFTFRTQADAQGKQYPMTVTIPSVDDEKVLLAGTATVNNAEADVNEFIDMFLNGEVDLSNVLYGGAISDAFSIVDSRFMDIVAYVKGESAIG